MALGRRDQTGHPIEPGMTHHSDAGSQGGFNWSSQRLDPFDRDGGPRGADRLHSFLGDLPPEEYEREYTARTIDPSNGDAANKTPA